MKIIKPQKNRRQIQGRGNPSEIHSLTEYERFYFPKKTKDMEDIKVEEKDSYQLGVALFEKSFESLLN